ncbi:MAG TPA: hypothetical protein VJT16_15490 [Streptosporangiaceae bacterium]|jgi:hypothetical protein|nr:hypothetical protein [Streptosporangiaceae bacterium]
MSELVLAYLRVLVWRAAVGFGLWIGRRQVQTGLSHLAERIRHVTSLKAGRAEVTIGDQLEALQVELDETEIKAKKLPSTDDLSVPDSSTWQRRPEGSRSMVRKLALAITADQDIDCATASGIRPSPAMLR